MMRKAEVYCEQKRAIPSRDRGNFQAAARKLSVVESHHQTLDFLPIKRDNTLMKKATITFCVKDDQVLLAMKKISFGSGKLNGYGGKIELNETPVNAAVRELREESGLIADPKDLRQVALINFYFAGEAIFECYIFITNKWTGEAIETEEMSLPKYYPISNLPFDQMWAADTKWIPLILNGETIAADIDFSKDGKVVNRFEYKAKIF